MITKKILIITKRVYKDGKGQDTITEAIEIHPRGPKIMGEAMDREAHSTFKGINSQLVLAFS